MHQDCASRGTTRATPSAELVKPGWRWGATLPPDHHAQKRLRPALSTRHLQPDLCGASFPAPTTVDGDPAPSTQPEEQTDQRSRVKACVDVDAGQPCVGCMLVVQPWRIVSCPWTRALSKAMLPVRFPPEVVTQQVSRRWILQRRRSTQTLGARVRHDRHHTQAMPVAELCRCLSSMAIHRPREHTPLH